MPVGLRHDGNTQSLTLQETTDDGHAKRRVINVGIATEQDDVQFVPAT